MTALFNWFSQIGSIAKFGFMSIPQRRGSVAATARREEEIARFYSEMPVNTAVEAGELEMRILEAQIAELEKKDELLQKHAHWEGVSLEIQKNKGGKVVDRLVGLNPKKKFQDMLSRI